MNRMSRIARALMPALVACASMLALVVLGLPIATRAAGTYLADAPNCGARVAILGADIPPDRVFPVQQALKVGAHTDQRRETLADEQTRAHSLGIVIPPLLLGQKAVSSALFHQLRPGAGLTITVSPGVTLDSARTYANALLTAGIRDAEVRVAAPNPPTALGTTALLSLFRAAEVSCHRFNPIREGLAITEVILTSRLAEALGTPGPTVAANLMARLKKEAVLQHLTTPAALLGSIDRNARALGITVPAPLANDLVPFLKGLVNSGVYDAVANRGVTFTRLTPLEVVAHVNSTGTGGTKPAPAATAHPSGTAAVPSATTHTGTVVSTTGASIKVNEGDTIHTYPLAVGLRVTRNGQASTLGAIQKGDKVVVTTDPQGRAIAITATAQKPVIRPTAVKPTVVAAAPVATTGSGNAFTGGGYAALAAGVLLALLLWPLLVALRRRRGEQRTVRATTIETTRVGTAAAPPSTFTIRPRARIPRKEDK